MQPSHDPAVVPFTIENVQPGMLGLTDEPDLYRIRLQPANDAAGGITIKYLAGPNTSREFTGPDAYIRRYNNLAFDTVPVGDWVIGWLRPVVPVVVIAEKQEEEEEGADDGQGGKLELASIETDTAAVLRRLGLCSAEPTWCGTVVDEWECQDSSRSGATTTVVDNTAGEAISVPKPTDIQCMDYVSASIIAAPSSISIPHTATQHGLSGIEEGGRNGNEVGEMVVRVWDWLPGHWVGIANESHAYEMIHARDPGLAPRFLGHIAENRGTRVIGFLLERIPDAREAGPADLGRCRLALARLHALGILKGRLRRHSFLVRGDGSVLIQGPFTGPLDDGLFDNDKDQAMKMEMDSLEKELARSPSVFEDQSARMLRLVDPRRRKLLEELEKEHGFLVPFVYWQESCREGGRITLTIEQHGVLAKEYEENGFRWTKELQEQAEKRFGSFLETV